MAKRLAYMGPAGTHSEQAALTYDSEAKRLAVPSIAAAAAAVDSDIADEAVVPIENSLEGSVTTTVDLLIHDSKLFIRHELVLPIKHYLVAADWTRSENIKVVYSHPQALGQCRAFFAKYYPNVDEVASMSTAAAVEEMLDRGPGTAAVATTRAASLYGAKVLEEGIEDNSNNMTRFVVLAPTDHPPTGSDKTSICFSFDEDAPGILHGVLSEFANRGINLAKIESRPTKQDLGRYIFLVDLEGHREDTEIRETLRRAESQVSMFKVFGSYPRYALPS